MRAMLLLLVACSTPAPLPSRPDASPALPVPVPVPAPAPDAGPPTSPPPQPPPPPATKSLTALPLAGPFPRTQDYCSSDKQVPRKCTLDRGVKRTTPPYTGAEVLRVEHGANGQGPLAYAVAIATSTETATSAWFVSDEFAASATTLDSVSIDDVVPGGAPELLVRGNTASGPFLIVCGIGSSSRPSCTRPLATPAPVTFRSDGMISIDRAGTFLPRLANGAADPLPRGTYALVFP